MTTYMAVINNFGILSQTFRKTFPISNKNNPTKPIKLMRKKLTIKVKISKYVT